MIIPEQTIPYKTRWYDVFDVQGSSIPIEFKSNRLYSVTERQHWGRGVRVNIDGHTGFAYTSDPLSVDETAEGARILARYGDIEDFDLPRTASVGFEPYDDGADAFDIGLEVVKCETAIGTLLARYPRLVVDVDVGNYSGTVTLRNSEGLDLSYRRSMYSAQISALLTMDDGTRLEIFDSMSSLRPEPFSALPDAILTKIDNALQQQKAPRGMVPVLLTPRAFAGMMRILTGGLNARAVWKGISPYKDRLGDRMFHPSFTVRDNPLDVSSPYSYPFDDEGVPARTKDIFNKGNVMNYVTDLKHAAKLGIQAQGNAARGYSSLPSPSFSFIEVEGGTSTMENLMRAFDTMVLADQFLGLGQSNTLTGDFSVNLELAYLVEKGDITGRIKDCMIAGNLFDLLKQDIMLGIETITIGSVKVPYILFPSISLTGG